MRETKEDKSICAFRAAEPVPIKYVEHYKEKTLKGNVI
jgi:hypothetical protein